MSEQSWHKDYEGCIVHGGTEHPYYAKGMCKVCYGKQYRERQKGQEAKAVRVAVSQDPVYQQILDEIEILKREYEQLVEALGISRSDHVGVIAEASEMVQRARRGLTEEELQKARHHANWEMEKQVEAFHAKLQERYEQAITEKKVWYVPSITDVIPIAQFAFQFTEGVGRWYPPAAIDAYENKQEQLAKLAVKKRKLGAKKYGQDFIGIEVDSGGVKLRQILAD